jgi:glutathione S-transferase
MGVFPVILIGQYDSPFVRRVGIALTLYGIPFEQWPWSIFSDADKLQAHNPLIRVPTLVLDSGEALIESHIIIDYLDSLVPPDRRMFPAEEPARHQALRVAALATGLSDKAVSLFYETRLHSQVSDIWVKRCRSQIAAVLALLERERAERKSAYWFGPEIGHADIAVACVLRFLGDVHPDLFAAKDHPALERHTVRLEALPTFKTISQAFIAPT